jgi:hypothetical protein
MHRIGHIGIFRRYFSNPYFRINRFVQRFGGFGFNPLLDRFILLG